MSLFSKLTKSNDKATFPWAQRKLGGGSNVLPRFGHAAAAFLPDHLVIYGGTHRGNTKKILFIIDTSGASASAMNSSGDIPPPRSYPTLVGVRNSVLLYGGEPNVPDEKWDPNVYLLNLSNRQWVKIRMNGAMPMERSKHSTCVHDGVMYVWGGQRAGRYLDDMIAFDTNSYPANPRWDTIVPKTKGPSARAGHASAICENKFYVFGGTDGNNIYNDIWAYDFESNAWTKLPATGYIPKPRTDCGAAVADGMIYVFGGRGLDGHGLDDLCAFRIRDQRWFTFQNMGPSPSPRFHHTMTAVREKIFILGGESTAKKLEDAAYIYVLDCAKIRYPPEPTVQAPSANSTSLGSSATLVQNTAEPEASSGHQAPLQSSVSTPVRSSPGQQQQRHVLNSTPPIFTAPTDRANTTNSLGPETDTKIAPQSSHSTPLPSDTKRTGHKSYIPEPTQQQDRMRHTSLVPEAARRRTRTVSPMPPQVETNVEKRQQPGPLSPSSVSSSDSDNQVLQTQNSLSPLDDRNGIPLPSSRLHTHPRNTMGPVSPPPRPSREGVKLNNTYRNTMITTKNASAERSSPDDRPKSYMPLADALAPALAIQAMPGRATQDARTNESPSTPERSLSPSARAPANPVATLSKSTQDSQERSSLKREIRARDMIISEMKKKEQWWRTEVSIARHIRALQNEILDNDPEVDEAKLETFEDVNSDKLMLFDQLVNVKAELRRVRASIAQHAQPMSQKVEQADRMRTVALQETAYYKSAYMALKADEMDELIRLETERAQVLENRLAAALAENEASNRTLQQLQRRVQHDHATRIAAEERAKEAHERAQAAQDAQERALDELASLHSRAVKAEAQAREDALQIAELTNQLAQALSTESSANALSEATITITRLEAANLKARNEIATLKQRLAEGMDDVARLKTLLSEREEALRETVLKLEEAEIQLGMMRDALNRKGMTNGPLSAAVPMNGY